MLLFVLLVVEDSKRDLIEDMLKCHPKINEIFKCQGTSYDFLLKLEGERSDVEKLREEIRKMDGIRTTLTMEEAKSFTNR